MSNFILNDILVLDYDEFNKMFHAYIVTLPYNIIASGYNNGKWYIIKHKKNTDIQKNRNMHKKFLNYWITNIHPKINKNKYYFLLCVYDGYRERIPYFDGKMIPYIPSKHEFLNMNEIKLNNNNIYPLLHKNKYILTFSKQITDDSAICVPDMFYIQSHGYINTLIKKIDDNRIDFSGKNNICIYRGNINNGSLENLINNKYNMNQRKYLKSLYKSGKIQNIDFEDDYKSIEDQLKYKYILDIDGWSNTWDSTVWKLYSGSVMLKAKGIWKQWYYDELLPWVHYVPVENDFFDLNDKIKQ